MLITLPENSNTVRTSFTVQRLARGPGREECVGQPSLYCRGAGRKTPDVSYQTGCLLRATTPELWVLLLFTAKGIPSGIRGV